MSGSELPPPTVEALALIATELARIEAELAGLDLWARAQALSAAMARVKFSCLGAGPPGPAELVHGAALAVLALALTLAGAVITEGPAEDAFDPPSDL